MVSGDVNGIGDGKTGIVIYRENVNCMSQVLIKLIKLMIQNSHMIEHIYSLDSSKMSLRIKHVMFVYHFHIIVLSNNFFLEKQ